MTWKLYLELTSPQFFPGKSWVGRRCCQMLHCMVGFYTVQVQDEDSTGVGSKNRRHSTQEKKKKVSFACIIYVTPTNYLGLAPSKSQNMVDLLEGIFSLSHHAPQSSLHPKEVSSPTSDTAELRLLLF